MNAISCLRTLCRVGLTLVCVPAIYAQSVAPAVTDTSPPIIDQEVVVMTPFTVSAEKERGYLATETLAGMRLRTNLKDVGAAVDVLTDQFLNDVGAVDMTDALKYIANMSVFDFADNDVQNNSQWYSTSFTSRGITGSTVLTDFFETGALPVDRYNTENLTFMRGPNAILFGIGSPSGMVGASTKRASLSKNGTTLRLVFDRFGSRRFDFDTDLVLVKNKLGVRVAGVVSDKQTFQDPSKNERNALYLTASYRPFRKTKITANVEWGEWNRLHSINNLVGDAYTPWVKAGKPTFNWVTGEGAGSLGWASSQNNDTKKQKFNKGVGAGLQSISSGQYLVYIEGSNLPIMDWRQMARGAQHLLDVPNSDVWAPKTWAPGTMLTTDRNKLNDIPFTKDNAIVDLDANIWGSLSTNDLEYSRQSVFIEQNIARGLDLEVAANWLNTEYEFFFFGNPNPYIYVDACEVLPDGTPNPYVGMPYIETGNNAGNSRMRERNEFANYRATLSYELNLDKHKIYKNLGFGNYRFAGLAQRNERQQLFARSRFVNVTPLPGTGGNVSLNNNVNRISRRYYLQPGESYYRHDGTIPPGQPNSPGAWTGTNGPIKMEERSADEAPRNNLTDLNSWVFAMQGAWWFTEEGWPRITALYGQRHDEQVKQAQSFTRNSKGEYPNAPASLDVERFGVWGAKSRIKANTKSYNATIRPISPVRFFYNYSDIYVLPATATAVDVWGNALRPTMGETKDFGVKIDLFGDRLYLTATKFKTSTIDTIVDNTGTIRTPLNQIYEAIGRDDLVFVRPMSYRDDSTKGYEFALNLRLFRTWNTRVAVGTQKTIIESTYEDWVKYFEQYRPLWAANADVPVASTTYGTVAGAAAEAERTLINNRALIGQQPTGQRDYNVSFTTNYAIPSGQLKGLRFGAGVRWQSENNLGYARNPDDPIGNFDFDRPYKGPATWATDLTIGYSRKIYRNKLMWDIQLNIFNILDDRDPLPRRAADNGAGEPVYVMYYPVSPIGVQLTNSFKF